MTSVSIDVFLSPLRRSTAIDPELEHCAGDFIAVSRRISLTYVEQTSRSHARNGGARSWNANAVVVTELAKLLLANPGGLRRWSVMRAMRRVWQASQQEVSLKFEDEIERHFRYFSANDDCAKSPDRAREALFFRPSDKAGEVWAAEPERVRTWLMVNNGGEVSPHS